MKSKPKIKSIDIFGGLYVYEHQFVFVKRVKGKHIAETKDGVRFRPFDVLTKGRRVDTSNKNRNSLN